MRVSDSAMEVVGINRKAVGRSHRGEYSTRISPTTDVAPVAVKAEQGFTQRKHGRTLRLESNYNPRGAYLEHVAVVNKSEREK